MKSWLARPRRSLLTPSLSQRRALTSATSSNSSTTSTSVTSSSSSADDVRVFNSLRGALEPLPRGELKWYACGPTVYDRAHLGHARAYVSQDVLRRVLEKRFGFHVRLVMGVTDVDDKILARARESRVDFAALARAEERAFFRDMRALHVQPPTAVTRVSEHMADIVAYVQRIQANGFAYEAADGSGVYFHTQQLGDAYGKLDPRRAAATPISTTSSTSSSSSSSSSDGALAEAASVEEDDEAAAAAVGKKDPRDFALWKTAKRADEPAWESPWGRGRPGWHIECSAMTHHALGAKLDVHTGGIDLKFPHHNNEIAQCDAHSSSSSCCPQPHAGDWCQHFIHFGHLYIQGLKMSKSLKNFVSVQDFLATHAPDHFRLFCLQFKYRANLHYSDDRIRDAVAVADRVRGFFRSVQAYSALGGTSGAKRCEQPDLELLDALFAAKLGVDAALRDDFDTPRALALVLELISRTNEYLLGRPDGPSEVLLAVASYVLELLDLFGLEGLHGEFAHVPQLFDERSDSSDASRPTAPPSSELGASGEEILRALVQFRAAVREQALQDPRAAQNAAILALCDAVRNDELPPLGVHVEDLAPGKSIFKLSSKEEREAATAAALAADADAKALAAQLAAKQTEFEALMQLAPTDLFRLAPEFAGRFSAFDASGVPTHDENAEPLTKSQRKKLLKKLEKHAKSFAKHGGGSKQPQQP